MVEATCPVSRRFDPLMDRVYDRGIALRNPRPDEPGLARISHQPLVAMTKLHGNLMVAEIAKGFTAHGLRLPLAPRSPSTMRCRVRTRQPLPSLVADRSSPAPPPDRSTRSAASPSPAATSAPRPPRNAAARPRTSPAAAAGGETELSDLKRAMFDLAPQRFCTSATPRPEFYSGEVHSGQLPRDPGRHPPKQVRGQRVFHASSTVPIPEQTPRRGGRRVGNATQRLEKGDVRSWRAAGSAPRRPPARV